MSANTGSIAGSGGVVGSNRAQEMRAMDLLPEKLRRFLHAAEGKWKPSEAVDALRRGFTVDHLLDIYRERDGEVYARAIKVYDGQTDDVPKAEQFGRGEAAPQEKSADA